jgi:preprotein translocase subunit SecD
VLLGLALLLYGVIAAGVTWDKAQWAPKLALDLAGGAEIVIAPVPLPGTSGKIDANTLARSVEIIRQRINGNGVSEAEITTQGQNIVVSLPGKPDPVTEKLVEQSAQLRFRAVLGEASSQPAATATPTSSGPATPSGTAPSTAKPTANATSSPPSGVKSTATLAPSAAASSNGAPIPPAALRQATATPGATTAPTPSAGSTGTAKPSATPTKAGAATPAPAPTNASDLNWAAQPVAPGSAETYETKFAALDCTKRNRGQSNDDPKKPLTACSQDGTVKFLLGPAEVIGTDVTSASASPEVNSQGNVTGAGWQVNLSFSGSGAKKFADVTTRLAALTGAQNQFAIVLDGLVVSYPGTREAITTGSAQITGSFTETEATGLANQLKFGALPISFTTLTKQDISATLGSEQLQRGLLAGLIGLLLVVFYSLAQYRALGFLTVASLTVAGSFTYGFVVLLGWRQGYRLSLAGVAGLIVSIGITADSFIVYFERVRDEVREGRSLLPAVEAAWQRARRTILASDAVSFLAAVVLFLLALGSVKGFAFTLGLTTLIDILVVFLFTKPMVVVLARTKFFGGGHKLSGFDPEHLGRSVAYAGRGRVRTPAAAATGGTIAERRAAMLRAQSDQDDPGPGAGDPGGGDPGGGDSGGGDSGGGDSGGGDSGGGDPGGGDTGSAKRGPAGRDRSAELAASGKAGSAKSTARPSSGKES